MAIGKTLRKIKSVIENIRENASYHYSDQNFAVLRYLYFSLFRINKFLAFEYDRIADAPPFEFETPFRIEVKTDADELRRICTDHQMPRECYYADILNLHLCFLLYHEDEIALIYWISLPGEYSRFFKLKPDTAELYYVTTLPRFRGRALSEKIARYACHYLRQAGYRKAVVVIHKTNIASIKPMLRAGFKQFRTITAIGPFNLKVRC